MGKAIVERTLVEGEAVQEASGAAYQLQEDDTDALVRLTHGSAITLTVPADATLDFPVGTEIDVVQGGAGAVTVTAAGGVTLQSRGGLVSTNGLHSRICLTKIADNTWNISGDRV